MSRRKKPPEVSTIKRPATVAYARKQKPSEGDNDKDEADKDDDVEVSTHPTMKLDVGGADAPVKPKGAIEEVPDRPTMTIDPAMVRAIADEPTRSARATNTTGMNDFGAPPEIPQPSSAAIVIKGGAVEDPTHMPGPRDIPPGNPDDVASPPGFVPPGDSRSLRRRGAQYEFALVYRVQNAVISRFGVVGTRGVWRVVEYPTGASASNAYAREASRFVTDGFSDYRE